MNILAAELNQYFTGDEANILSTKLMEHTAADVVLTSAVALKRNSAFTPTTAGDWPVQPTTIQEAIDKLAARVKALEP